MTAPRAMERRFWAWWTEGVVAAGVQTESLPRLRFVRRIVGPVKGGPGALGCFRDGHSRRTLQFRPTIRVLAALCGRVQPVQRTRVYESDGLPDRPALRVHLWHTPNLVTDGAEILAHECAHFEQFAWAHEGGWPSKAAEEASARRRGAQLLRLWRLSEWAEETGAPHTYRPPRYARGRAPWNLAGRYFVPLKDGRGYAELGADEAGEWIARDARIRELDRRIRESDRILGRRPARATRAAVGAGLPPRPGVGGTGWFDALDDADLRATGRAASLAGWGYKVADRV